MEKREKKELASMRTQIDKIITVHYEISKHSAEHDVAAYIAASRRLVADGGQLYRVSDGGLAEEWSPADTIRALSAMCADVAPSLRARWCAASKARNVHGLLELLAPVSPLHPAGSVRCGDTIHTLHGEPGIHAWRATTPATDYAEWEATVLDWMSGDAAMARYLQLAYGAAALGWGRDLRSIIVHVGAGRNGKSLYHRVIQTAMGDYATACSVHTLLSPTLGRDGSAHAADVVALHGRRLIVASESDIAHKLDGARLKAITGGDTIVARRPYATEPITVDICGLIALSTNAIPRVDWDDQALLDRLIVVDWMRQYEHDPAAAERIMAMAPQAMAWLLDGARLYLQSGRQIQYPGVPTCLRGPDEGVPGEGTLHTWLREHVTHDATGRVTATQLLSTVREAGAWTGDDASGIRLIGRQLAAMGMTQSRTASGRYWRIRITL